MHGQAPPGLAPKERMRGSALRTAPFAPPCLGRGVLSLAPNHSTPGASWPHCWGLSASPVPGSSDPQRLSWCNFARKGRAAVVWSFISAWNCQLSRLASSFWPQGPQPSREHAQGSAPTPCHPLPLAVFQTTSSGCALRTWNFFSWLQETQEAKDFWKLPDIPVGLSAPGPW